MKHLWTLLFAILFIPATGQLTITEVGQLPEAVSNNAVCEGFINGEAYLYSFGGIDTTKLFSGIHNRCFRYNIETGVSETIDTLPDNRGKVGSAASRIGDKIYIAGGYYVNADGSEITSDKLHIYDIPTNTFLPDGPSIPVPTDDHVQVVWRDSLIYLITGWSNSFNIRDVQIYNPTENTWTAANLLPNNPAYRSFGASGVIIQDTIYYFGGANSGSFSVQKQIRKGIINPDDPTQITWTAITPDANIAGYRAAATRVRGNEAHWVGGSDITYNYDGIAYNGTGGVPPTNRDLYTTTGTSWQSEILDEIPMDLRGIAMINDTVQYIAGGMLSEQQVTNKVYMLEWVGKTSSYLFSQSKNLGISIFPNPTSSHVTIELPTEMLGSVVTIYDLTGEYISKKHLLNSTERLEINNLPSGTYSITINKGTKNYTHQLIKH